MILIGSTYISDGAELLLLIPKIAPLVGSVILPLLGALPDSFMVLFSGLGPIEQLQHELSVGIGTLAGSTVMLLTIPSTLSIIAGRVDIRDPLDKMYKKPKLTQKGLKGLLNSGVLLDTELLKFSRYAMIITCVPYILIQSSAWAYQYQKNESDEQSIFALVGFIICVISFIVYMIFHFKRSGNDTILKEQIDEIRIHAIKKGLISLCATSDNDPVLVSRVIHEQFKKYDSDNNNELDHKELKFMLQGLNEPHTDKHVSFIMSIMDTDHSGSISLKEFINFMSNGNSSKLSETENNTRSEPTGNQLDLEGQTYNEDLSSPKDPENRMDEDQDDQEEEDEIPEDLAHLPIREQRKRIIIRALCKITFGMFLVILFSDPIVDALSELAKMMHISPFYVSFVLTPFASNLTEVIATYYYALNKSKRTMGIAFSTILGAIILNNTYVLGVFLILIKVRGAVWQFTAETLAILIVELFMFLVLSRRVLSVRVSLMILSVYPLTLVFVGLLEGLGGID
jgi:Ca2+/Na+ antiporter